MDAEGSVASGTIEGDEDDFGYPHADSWLDEGLIVGNTSG